MKRLMFCAMALMGAGALMAEDAYIESNGSQFINTGYYPSGKTKIEVDFQLTEAKTSYDCVFGNYGSTFSVLLYAKPGNTYFQCCGKDGNWSALSTDVSIDTARHTMVIDVPKKKGTMYAPDGTAQGQADFNSVWSYNNTANWPIALFASCNNASGTSARQGIVGRIYGAKIWESDDGGATYSLLHNYVPATKGGYVGFYDTETGDFLSNQPASSAAFTYGGEPLEVEDDPYIENDGSAYSAVDTRYFPNKRTKVEVDFREMTLAKNKDIPFGHYSSTDYSLLIYRPVSDSLVGTYKLVAKDGEYLGLELSPAVSVDTRRHTAIIDIPGRHVEMRTPDGLVQGSANLASKTAWSWNFNTVNCPLMIFGYSTDAYGNSDQRIPKGRIYGVRIYENANDDGTGEWTAVHNFGPCLKNGVPGFKDSVTGTFISGGNITASANVPEEDEEDAYIDTTTAGLSISFDTGYMVSSNTCIVCDFRPLKQKTDQSFVFEAGDGTSANDNGQMFMRMYANGQAGTGGISYACGCDQYHTVHLNGDTSQIWFAPNVRRTLTLDAYNSKVSVAMYGKTISEKNLSATARLPEKSPTTLKIFSNRTGAGNYCMARLYSFQIYESGSLVRDYRPYVKNGVVGLRDVEGDGGFITASNAANAPKLKCGGNIEGRRDAYIENNHKTVLDLGYKANMSSRIEFDYQWLDVSNSGGEVVCGAWNDGTLMYCVWYYPGVGVEFIFGGNSKSPQSVLGSAADTMRHTAIIDMYNRSLAYVTGGVTNNVTVNSSATFNASDASVSGMGVFAGMRTSGAGGMVSLARVYSVRIYETHDNVETMVHEFLPYKNGDIVSLRDTVTGHVATKATASEPWPTIGGKGVDGAERWLATPQNRVLRKGEAAVTLSANASGAIKYKWTRNDEDVDGGEDGNLEVRWTRGGATDEYKVTPVYNVYGVEIEGDPVVCNVLNQPPGMAILIR